MVCGHIFGAECIEKWFGSKSRTSCPVCARPGTKKQLRPIYATKLVALDKEGEKKLVEMYLKEQQKKNEAMEEQINLRTQLECLRLELKQLREGESGEKERSFRIHRRQRKSLGIDFLPNGSIIEYDEVNTMLLVSCRRGASPGIQRYGSSGFSKAEFLKLDDGGSRIKDMEMSPFKDGLMLAGIGNKLKLINMYNGIVVMSHTMGSGISSVCFDLGDRNTIYCGDEKGIVHRIDVSSDAGACSIELGRTAIHSICKGDSALYAASIHALFKLTPSGAVPLEAEGAPICTNISTSGRHILVTFRDPDLKVRHYLCGEIERYFSLGLSQIKRHRDRIFGGYAYVVDDSKNTLLVLNPSNFRTVYSYRLLVPILDFCVSHEFLFILTPRGIQVFDASS
jgi:E3 ubiquitin-protein ligase RFWD3